MSEFFVIRTLTAMSVPLIIYSTTRKIEVFKKKPYLLYVVMAIPSIIISYLLLG